MSDYLEVTQLEIEKHRKSDATIRFKGSNGQPVSGQVVEINQKAQDFLFGNLIFDLIWSDPLYKPELFKQRFTELFNFAIFPFYWSYYERTPGMPKWEKMLPVLEWCQGNGITPKGHPLVWPYDAGVPVWLYDMPAGSVEAHIKSRVINTVKGFEPYINIWDVTNEAVNHISWKEATQPEFKLRMKEVTSWRGIPVAGAFKREIPIPEAADWVEDSLCWAYAANPKAALIVNDYNQEVDKNIRQRFYDLIRELQDRGAPISGIGLQVHPVDYWIRPEDMWETLEMYRMLNLPVHITELHQPSWDKPIEGGYRDGNWSETRQAEFMEQIYRLCFGHPSVVSINYWGLSDRNIWIKSAGLIDEEYQPKPVFETLKRLIKGEWMTSAFRHETDADGRLTWRGFQGEYEVAVHRPGERAFSRKIHLAQDEANSWEFTL